MNIETVIYLAEIIPSIGAAFFVLTLVSAVAAFVGIPICAAIANNIMDEKEEDKFINNSKKNYSRFIKVWLILLFTSCLFPSEKTIYLMLGANYLKTSTLPSKVEMAIEKKIDSYLNEKDEKK